MATPYLILAGDIGQLVDYELYLDYLRSQCCLFTPVFLVLGNHESYGLSRGMAYDEESYSSKSLISVGNWLC
jgi:hypothetical protein